MTRPDDPVPATTFSARLRSTFIHAAVVVLGFAAFHAWFWSRLVFGDGYLAHSDLYEYFLPVFLSPRTIWSSFEFAGFPAFADPQNSLWYPVHLLFARGLHWWNGFVVSAYFIASLGAYAFVYQVTRSRLAAVFAGLSWPLSEAMAERYPHLAMLHGFAWLPALLYTIEKLRPAGTMWVAVSALAVATIALTGHPQVPIYCFYLAGLYGLTQGVATRAPRAYYVRLAGAFALGGLLTAVQTIPLAEIGGIAARVEVGFTQFADSFAKQPHELLTALVPELLHEGREAPTYAGAVAVVCGALLLVAGRPGWRGWFWGAAALVCLLLGLGSATPLAELAYHLPLYDRFRIVARHLALFVFAVVMLGSLGVAALERGEVRRWRAATAALVVAGAVAWGLVYVRSTPGLFEIDSGGGLQWLPALAGSELGAQAVVWVLALAAAGWLGVRRWPRLAAVVLIAVALVDLANAQPEPVRWTGFQPPSLLDPELAGPSVHTEWLRDQLAADQQRMLPLEGSGRDPFSAGVFARLWRTPSVGGYGPLLLGRLARAAGMEANGAVRPSVLLASNRVLDVLATKLIVVPAETLDRPAEVMTRGGIEWTAAALDLPISRPDCGDVHPGRVRLALPHPVEARRLALAMYLRCAEDAAQGATVGTATLVADDGRRLELPLRAGMEVAEAYEGRPELDGRLRHGAAPVFETSGEGNDRQTVYVADLAYPETVKVAAIEIAEGDMAGWLTLNRATVLADDGTAFPLATMTGALGNDARFREVRRVRASRRSDRGADESSDGESEYVILENLMALPRAWLVGDVVDLDERDMLPALAYSQLPDGRAFEPSSTAFVVTGAATALPSTGQASGTAKITRTGDGYLRIASSSSADALLAVSEMWYPGWSARVDGEPAEVLRVDYLIMGVQVPAGRHVVELVFDPASLKIGMTVSAAALVVVVGLAAWPWRRRRP